ncbi:MAG: hypothetical protein JWP89_3105 [Schlesneria sp.]|nr:hypothetical protein [Schlesneria sp.]
MPFLGARSQRDFARFGHFVEEKSATLVAFASPDAQINSYRLTDFDTPGQFLTMGDKTALFSAVFLKKVDVL